MFIVFVTHSDELFEFMRISQDDIESGDKNDVINEEDTLDVANIFLHKVMALINASVKIINYNNEISKIILEIVKQ